MSEKKVTPRKTLADGKTGVEALMALAKNAPKAPSAAERLAQARAERDAKVQALLTTQVKAAIKGLRDKGYGFGVIANTINDTLAADVKISARHVKELCEPQPKS